MYTVRNLIYTCFSTIGFVCHVFYISKAYFQYATVVDLSLQIPQKIVLPGITICHDIFTPLSKAKFNRSLLHDYPFLFSDDFRQHAARMPIKNLFQIVDTIFDLKIDCTILCSQNEILNITDPYSCASINCSQVSRVTPTITMLDDYYFNKCFTYFHRLSNQTLIYEQNLVPDLLRFRLHSSIPHTIHLAIHSPKRIPNIGSVDKILLKMSDVLRVDTAFRMSVVQSYYCRKFPQGSHLGCFHECERQIMLRNCGSWPYVIPAPESVEIPFFNGSKGCEPRPNLIFEWRNSCPQCGGNDCFKLHFINHVRALSLANGERKKFEMEINVRKPYRFFEVYISRPKIILAEFLVYLGSCVGIWFGASVIHIVKITMVCIKLIKIKAHKIYPSKDSSREKW